MYTSAASSFIFESRLKGNLKAVESLIDIRLYLVEGVLADNRTHSAAYDVILALTEPLSIGPVHKTIPMVRSDITNQCRHRVSNDPEFALAAPHPFLGHTARRNVDVYTIHSGRCALAVTRDTR